MSFTTGTEYTGLTATKFPGLQQIIIIKRTYDYCFLKTIRLEFKLTMNLTNPEYYKIPCIWYHVLFVKTVDLINVDFALWFISTDFQQ